MKTKKQTAKQDKIVEVLGYFALSVVAVTMLFLDGFLLAKVI